MSLTTIIERDRGFRLFKWKEVLEYKDLLYFLIVRGVKAKYAQSVLGIGWAMLQPLLTMLIFTVIFGKIAGITSDGLPYPLFSFSGLLVWSFFSGALTDASNSLISNANMLSKVYFPRIVLPLSALLSKLIDWSIAAIVMAVLMVMYKHPPTLNLLFLPVLIILMLLTTLGPALILSAWAVQYRDIKYALSFIIQLLMYSAPVVYPLSRVPAKFAIFYSLNPLVGIVEGFRSSILGISPMPWNIILTGAAVTLLVLLFGLFSFSKLEKTLADIV